MGLKLVSVIPNRGVSIVEELNILKSMGIRSGHSEMSLITKI